MSDSESEEEVYRPVQGRRGQGKVNNHFMNIQYELMNVYFFETMVQLVQLMLYSCLLR